MMAKRIDQIMRMNAVREALGVSRTSLYTLVEKGFFPPAILLGPRTTGWRVSEVERIIAARARGASDDQIRAIVAEIGNERRTASHDVADDRGDAWSQSDRIWMMLLRLARRDAETTSPHLLAKKQALAQVKALLGELADTGTVTVDEIAACTGVTPNLVIELIERSDAWSRSDHRSVASM